MGKKFTIKKGGGSNYSYHLNSILNDKDVYIPKYKVLHNNIDLNIYLKAVTLKELNQLVQSDDKLKNSSYIGELLKQNCKYEKSIIENVSELFAHILDCRSEEDNDSLCIPNIDILKYILGLEDKVDSTFEARISQYYTKLHFSYKQREYIKNLIKNIYNSSSKEVLD